MSEFCENCPVTKTENFTGKYIPFCSNPAVACREVVDRIAQAMKSREILKSTADITKEGILPLFSLEEGDQLRFFMSEIGESLDDNLDRELELRIRKAEMDDVVAEVIADSYNDLGEDDERAEWAISEGSDITLLGGYDHTAKTPISQEIHQGRGLLYEWRGDESIFTVPVREVLLWREAISMRLFTVDYSAVAAPPALG